MNKIAVLLTCHNRKTKTINCLDSLYKALKLSVNEVKCDVFLVDDGSTDGTAEAVAANFPEVNVITGSGQLYWAGGMRLAWETAINENKPYDFYLLLNDDVVLNEDFLKILLDTHAYCLKHYNRAGIYVSSTIDKGSAKISYGGVLVKSQGIRSKSISINPGDVPVPCSMTNANILLVSCEVVAQIGILDANYTHQFADYDYSFLASRMGIPVLVCPGVGGSCVNDHGKSWLAPGSSLKDRINYLYSPLGLAYKEQLYYIRKNFKYQFPYYFTMLWMKTLFPVIWEKMKKEER